MRQNTANCRLKTRGNRRESICSLLRSFRTWYPFLRANHASKATHNLEAIQHGGLSHPYNQVSEVRVPASTGDLSRTRFNFLRFPALQIWPILFRCPTRNRSSYRLRIPRPIWVVAEFDHPWKARGDEGGRRYRPCCSYHHDQVREERASAASEGCLRPIPLVCPE